MDDGLQPYEDGLKRLFALIDKGHEIYLPARVLQARLLENIKRMRLYGETDGRNSNRAEIIDSLNQLLLPALKQSFNELCGLDEPLQTQKLQRTPLSASLDLASVYIMNVQTSLYYTHNLFSNQEDILPEQSARALEALQKIGVPITTSDASEYPLMVQIYRVDGYIHELIQLIRDFRRVCRTSSPQKLTKWEKIDHKLDLLIQSIGEVNTSIDACRE